MGTYILECGGGAVVLVLVLYGDHEVVVHAGVGRCTSQHLLEVGHVVWPRGDTLHHTTNSSSDLYIVKIHVYIS